MLNKILKIFEESLTWRGNRIHAAETKAKIEKMFAAGWDALPNETVILAKNNKIALKKDNSLVILKSKSYTVRNGVLIEGDTEMVEVKEVPENKKIEYLAQAIITKYWI